jgi:hypothetical protein
MIALFFVQVLEDGLAIRGARFVFLHRQREGSAADLAANFSVFAAEMKGLVITAAVDCSLRTTTAVCSPYLKAGLKLPTLRLLPPPTYATALKGAHQPPGIAAPLQLDALREIVPRLFADHRVNILSPNNLHAFLGSGSNPTSRAILFTKKTRVPVVWRAVSSSSLA